jgi:hypothetical protein
VNADDGAELAGQLKWWLRRLRLNPKERREKRERHFGMEGREKEKGAALSPCLYSQVLETSLYNSRMLILLASFQRFSVEAVHRSLKMPMILGP